MFDFERATDYIRSLELPGSALSEEIQKDALAGDVPIIRPETASFLLFLISLKKPLSILEVGTAVGYSAIRMSEQRLQRLRNIRRELRRQKEILQEHREAATLRFLREMQLIY